MGLETSEAFVEWLRPNSLCTENKEIKSQNKAKQAKKVIFMEKSLN